MGEMNSAGLMRGKSCAWIFVVRLGFLTCSESSRIADVRSEEFVAGPFYEDERALDSTQRQYETGP